MSMGPLTCQIWFQVLAGLFTPGIFLLKHFSSLLAERTNQLECFFRALALHALALERKTECRTFLAPTLFINLRLG
jgi:hypothetical protein